MDRVRVKRNDEEVLGRQGLTAGLKRQVEVQVLHDYTIEGDADGG